MVGVEQMTKTPGPEIGRNGNEHVGAVARPGENFFVNGHRRREILCLQAVPGDGEPRQDAAGHRVLGRLHTLAPKVPFFTGWVDRDKAVAELGVTVFQPVLSGRAVARRAAACGMRILASGLETPPQAGRARTSRKRARRR